MRSTNELVNRLAAAHPSLAFVESDEFRWSPTQATIFYTDDADASSYLLHELAHALLKHTTYSSDLELIAMERDAWSLATTSLAPDYAVTVDATLVETAMDSYRQWLHARSRCPRCAATGLETAKSTYTCLACQARWTVNEARVCRLKRTLTTK